MIKKKQFILFYTCKKGLSILLLLGVLFFQAKIRLYEENINRGDSIQIQEVIHVTENTLVYGLENVLIQKMQSPQVPNEVKKIKSISKKKKLKEKKIVNNDYGKILNQQKSFSLFPSDIFLDFGNFGLRAQLIITSNTFCFKKNIAAAFHYIFFLRKYSDCQIKIDCKDLLQIIISIFLILFRLRPPPIKNNLKEILKSIQIYSKNNNKHYSNVSIILL
ncbi:hypothetical protein [Chryseobacterium sp. SIMBA_028]|uniref:hypothetical protein n=1 Tax=Chryseobacterium sp. SIMBA_028 TaxID=3085771 RepID=UPI00397DF48E